MNGRRASVRIAVRELDVRLRRDAAPVRSLREYVVARLERRPRSAEWIEALTGVTFDVHAGELFAVVGANGAGKTTLLRALAGIVPPAGGSVRVDGRVAPLIELGAGFDPELTGEENVLLYGTLLGLRRAELRRRLGEIVEFAGTQAAARAALKTYSSGMIARLGFAVATAAPPDVLAVDEVLAVGDEEFRGRCLRRIDELRAAGTAVVLVTHDLGLVEREADRALLLASGRMRALGLASDVVAAYRRRSAA